MTTTFDEAVAIMEGPSQVTNIFAEAGMDSNLGPEPLKVPIVPADFIPAGESFWCGCCDGRKVIAGEPETGRFFSQFGHAWMPEKRWRDRLDNQMAENAKHFSIDCPDTAHVGHEYIQVIFAVCKECLNHE